MMLENKQANGDAQTDELTLLKKRARRRLIGAVAVALLAAIVLPMVMDHEPAPPLKDIQVRIPSPDEGADLKADGLEKPVARMDAKPIAKAEPKASQVSNEMQPDLGKAAAGSPISPAPVAGGEARPPAKSPAEPKAQARSETKGENTRSAGADSWEVQLGAYAEEGRVKRLLAKLKELGLPTYTEKVDTPNGPRTRVRAGPFPTREAAEKAQARIKIIGVDGSVARKS